MSAIDIVLMVLLGIGAYHGYKAGFLLELFSLIAIVLGILGAFKLMGFAMVMLADRFTMNEKVLPYLAFGLVFLLIVIAVNIIGKVIKASIANEILGSIDGAAGALLGMLRTAFMLSITLWIVESLKFKVLSGWTDGSWLYPMVANFAPGLTSWVSRLFPFFKDVF